MLYLKGFRLPGNADEEDFFTDLKRTCYTNYYPFGVFPSKELTRIDFVPITIFYGSNGSGKTTLLNVIAETIKAQRSASFNKSSFFGDYVNRCQAKWDGFYHDSTVITSDDVFDYLLAIVAVVCARAFNYHVLVGNVFYVVVVISSVVAVSGFGFGHIRFTFFGGGEHFVAHRKVVCLCSAGDEQ